MSTIDLTTPIDLLRPARVVFGAGTAAETGRWVRERGFTRILVVADAFNAALPTPKMVDAIYRAATVKLAPLPLIPATEKGAAQLPSAQRTDARESLAAFLQHNDLIQSQLGSAPPTHLVAGTKKDIVLTNRLAEKPGRVAIYGWHKLDGNPIQPLTIVHKDTYTDYSHGVRLVSTTMFLDDKPTDLRALLKNPACAALLSSEGPLTAHY